MYESLRGSKIKSLDTETFDPELIKKGPGVYRSKPLDFKNPNGYLLGFSITDEHGHKGYYNLGHYDCTEAERQKNLQYLRECVQDDDCIIIGANLLYDLDWIQNWALIEVHGKLVDVQTAESLLDENRRHYNLDSLGMDYFHEGKAKSEIDKFCEVNGLKGDPRKWLFKMPYYMVEEYAIQDVDLPIKIWQKQEPRLIDEELTELMDMECELLRMLLLMRTTGAKIDEQQRAINAFELQNRIEEAEIAIYDTAGKKFNYRSGKQLADIFDKLNIPYPTTSKGNPSITRDTLMKLSKGQIVENEGAIAFGTQLADLKRADKILKTFVNGSLKEFQTEGNLIHASFYPTKTDGFGTRSGRFSSANPNLQQIPSTGVDAYYGKIARQPFIPFEDHWWGKLDYSQIEYRFMAHFARGKGAEEVRAQYNANARTDYHQYIVDLTGLKRRYAKNLNFGVAYGMGAKHMAEFFQWDIEYCNDILSTYHSHAPFIKSTIKAVEQVSKRRGYIRTFLKRRSRLLDPNKAYTMFCRLTQGSAADLMKKALHDMYHAGIFDVLPPHLTVHDELDCSVPKTIEGIEAFVEAKRIMEQCVELKVPVIADMEYGQNWAELTEIKGDLLTCEKEMKAQLKKEKGIA